MRFFAQGARVPCRAVLPKATVVTAEHHMGGLFDDSDTVASR